MSVLNHKILTLINLRYRSTGTEKFFFEKIIVCDAPITLAENRLNQKFFAVFFTEEKKTMILTNLLRRNNTDEKV